jgi:hypothetical protein
MLTLMETTTTAEVLQTEALAMCGGDYNPAYFDLMKMPIVRFWQHRDRWVRLQEARRKASEE